MLTRLVNSKFDIESPARIDLSNYHQFGIKLVIDNSIGVFDTYER